MVPLVLVEEVTEPAENKGAGRPAPQLLTRGVILEHEVKELVVKVFQSLQLNFNPVTTRLHFLLGVTSRDLELALLPPHLRENVN